MPIITVQMWSGRSEEAKAGLIRNLTEATTTCLDVPAEAVTVLPVEIEKKHWGVGGETSVTKWPEPSDEKKEDGSGDA